MPELREEVVRLSEQGREPGTCQDLAMARRRRSRRRRAGALVVGFLVFAAAGVFLVATFRDQHGATPEDTLPTAWTTYTDPYGWTIDVPQGWRARVISEHEPRGAEFQGSDMSVQISIHPAVTESLPPGMTLPPGLTLPPSNDSPFPLHADQLLSNVEGGLGGQFFGDGQRFDVLVLCRLCRTLFQTTTHGSWITLSDRSRSPR